MEPTWIILSDVRPEVVGYESSIENIVKDSKTMRQNSWRNWGRWWIRCKFVLARLSSIHWIGSHLCDNHEFMFFPYLTATTARDVLAAQVICTSFMSSQLHNITYIRQHCSLVQIPWIQTPQKTLILPGEFIQPLCLFETDDFFFKTSNGVHQCLKLVSWIGNPSIHFREKNTVYEAPGAGNHETAGRLISSSTIFKWLLNHWH